MDIGLTKPFFRRDTLCGYVNEEIMIFPEHHNMSHCFTDRNITLPGPAFIIKNMHGPGLVHFMKIEKYVF